MENINENADVFKHVKNDFMTVGDLMKFLSDCPADYKVCVNINACDIHYISKIEQNDAAQYIDLYCN